MSNVFSAKKKIGRPRVDSEAVNVRMERIHLNALDAWASEKEPALTRPEAIRQILTDYLKRRGYLKTGD